MQPLVDTPRSTLTGEQVTALIQDSPALTVDGGLELLDSSLNMTEDISSYLDDGSVSRAYYDTLHGSASLDISRELDWGRALIRPYTILSDGTVTARFNLGAYYTDVPARDLDTAPTTFRVSCVDRLALLNDLVGDTFSVAAGTDYLTTVEALLLDRGVAAGTYVIDQEKAGTLAPSSRVWVFDDNLTWLHIINDLLGAIGYAGVWTDWNGRFRCEPYISPRERGAEWSYAADSATSMIGLKRSVERDFSEAPNRWVFHRSNNVEGSPPVEGDGLYSYENADRGDTSIEARGGRTITKVVGLDVADHSSLVARAQSIIDADMLIPLKLSMTTAPNPLHWHGDRVFLNDPAVGPMVDAVVTQWTYPLFGPEMSGDWTVL